LTPNAHARVTASTFLHVAAAERESPISAQPLPPRSIAFAASSSISEFIAAIKEKRESNGSLTQLLPCMHVLGKLESIINPRRNAHG
jgi:hypothetical protein